MTRWGLTLILVLYLGLAAGFARVTPFGKAPDETAHALYVQSLVRNRSLPVLKREHREAYEYHQPPLYYVLAAPAWAAVAGSGDLGGASATAARAVSILIGALGVWLIAALARTVWPGREALILAAAGFAALLPMRLATAASVSNDTLAEAVFTAALLVMARLLRDGADGRRAAQLGVCLGLGILSKSSDLLLFPVALAALLLAARPVGRAESAADRRQSKNRDRQSREAPDTAPATDAGLFLRCAAITFGVALLLGGGWMARNSRLYGDPLGTRAFEQYFQDTPTPDVLAVAMGYTRLELLTRKVLPLTFASFWGVFGHMNLFMGAYPRGTEPPAWTTVLADHVYPPASWLYPLLLLPSLIALAGLVKSGFQSFRHSRGHEDMMSRPEPLNPRTSEYLVLSLAWFLVVAAFLRFNTEFFQAQGRYLFPALGPIAMGFAAGWLAWWPARRQSAGAALLLLGLLALSLYALFGTVAPAFP